MIRFYRRVDLRSRSRMTEFLKNHFRYSTNNSWNQSQSYACNLKIYQLGLEREIEHKMYDLIETQDFFYAQNELLMQFGEKYQYRWQAYMNGRCNGYLVLYQGELTPSGYKSYCTECGQKNYQSVSESGNVCGVCGKPTRIDYMRRPMQVKVYPGRGTDEDEDYEEMSMEELRDRVRLVQEFDLLADRLVDRAIWLAKTCSVQEEEYFVSHTRKVLVSTGTY